VSPVSRPGAGEELNRLYREAIMRHARNPTGRGKVIRETHRSEQFNPLCGDHIILSLHIESNRVTDAAFAGEACAICTASASLLCEHAPGRSAGEMMSMRRWLESALRSEAPPVTHQALQPLLEVRDYPSRIRCALLPWDALAEAVEPTLHSMGSE